MSYTIDEKKVIYADLDPSEGMLLNLESKNYYRLNETGQCVWRGLAARKTPQEIASGLVSRYEVTPEEALRDVETIVDQLVCEGMLEEEERSEPVSPPIVRRR